MGVSDGGDACEVFANVSGGIGRPIEDACGSQAAARVGAADNRLSWLGPTGDRRAEVGHVEMCAACAE